MARADVVTSADFRVTSSEDNSVIFSAFLDTAVLSSYDIQWPTVCQQVSFQQQRIGSKTQLIYKAQCSEPFTKQSIIKTPWQLDGAKLFLSFGSNAILQTTLKKSYSSMQVPLYISSLETETKLDISLKYLWQGMIHIWMGWDHISFVLCLRIRYII